MSFCQAVEAVTTATNYCDKNSSTPLFSLTLSCDLLDNVTSFNTYAPLFASATNPSYNATVEAQRSLLIGDPGLLPNQMVTTPQTTVLTTHWRSNLAEGEADEPWVRVGGSIPGLGTAITSLTYQNGIGLDQATWFGVQLSTNNVVQQVNESELTVFTATEGAVQTQAPFAGPVFNAYSNTFFTVEPTQIVRTRLAAQPVEVSSSAPAAPTEFYQYVSGFSSIDGDAFQWYSSNNGAGGVNVGGRWTYEWPASGPVTAALKTLPGEISGVSGTFSTQVYLTLVSRANRLQELCKFEGVVDQTLTIVQCPTAGQTFNATTYYYDGSILVFRQGGNDYVFVDRNGVQTDAGNFAFVVAAYTYDRVTNATFIFTTTGDIYSVSNTLASLQFKTNIGRGSSGFLSFGAHGTNVLVSFENEVWISLDGGLTGAMQNFLVLGEQATISDALPGDEFAMSYLSSWTKPITTDVTSHQSPHGKYALVLAGEDSSYLARFNDLVAFREATEAYLYDDGNMQTLDAGGNVTWSSNTGDGSVTTTGRVSIKNVTTQPVFTPAGTYLAYIDPTAHFVVKINSYINQTIFDSDAQQAANEQFCSSIDYVDAHCACLSDETLARQQLTEAASKDAYTVADATLEFPCYRIDCTRSRTFDSINGLYRLGVLPAACAAASGLCEEILRNPSLFSGNVRTCSGAAINTASCNSSINCSLGSGCADKRCILECNEDADCPFAGTACYNGHCVTPDQKEEEEKDEAAGGLSTGAIAGIAVAAVLVVATAVVLGLYYGGKINKKAK